MEYLGVEAWLNSVRRVFLGVCEEGVEGSFGTRSNSWSTIEGVEGVHGVEDFARLFGVSSQLLSPSSMTA